MASRSARPERLTNGSRRAATCPELSALATRTRSPGEGSRRALARRGKGGPLGRPRLPRWQRQRSLRRASRRDFSRPTRPRAKPTSPARWSPPRRASWQHEVSRTQAGSATPSTELLERAANLHLLHDGVRHPQKLRGKMTLPRPRPQNATFSGHGGEIAHGFFYKDERQLKKVSRRSKRVPERIMRFFTKDHEAARPEAYEDGGRDRRRGAGRRAVGRPRRAGAPGLVLSHRPLRAPLRPRDRFRAHLGVRDPGLHPRFLRARAGGPADRPAAS